MQTGNHSSVTTGVDNALTGMGGQRAVQVQDDPYIHDDNPTLYLNRAAFTSPAAGSYSTLAPFTIVNPPNLQNDSAPTRNFTSSAAHAVQLRSRVFNVVNHENFHAHGAYVNRGTFG